MEKYFPYDYFALRLYDLMFSEVKEVERHSEHQYWGFIDTSDTPDWCFNRYKEVFQLHKSNTTQQMNLLMGIV